MVTLRKIPRDPILNSNILSCARRPSPFYPLTEEHLFLYGYGRVALYAGLRVLGLKKGDSVLVPNYICNVVIAPMHALGIRVKFYKVNGNLMPDWDSVERKFDKSTKALILVNYFGFPNDLFSARSFCKKHNIYLIEDNAQGFLSAQGESKLGSFGDISIFSFQKTLAMPNGAALLVNNKMLFHKTALAQIRLNKPKNVSRFLVKSLFLKLKYSLRLPPRDASLSHVEMAEEDFLQEYNIEKYFEDISSLSRWAIVHTAVEKVSAVRRKMYTRWLNFFSTAAQRKVKVLFEHLPKGVVPYCFPVLVENQQEFILDMYKRRIECFPWPFLPKDSQEAYFSRKIVCLPVSVSFKLRDFL